MTNSSHGEGLAVIEPAWLKNEAKKNPTKFVRFNKNVLNLPREQDMTDEAYALQGIDWLRTKYDQWGLPSTLNRSYLQF